MNIHLEAICRYCLE